MQAIPGSGYYCCDRAISSFRSIFGTERPQHACTNTHPYGKCTLYQNRKVRIACHSEESRYYYQALTSRDLFRQKTVTQMIKLNVYAVFPQVMKEWSWKRFTIFWWVVLIWFCYSNFTWTGEPDFYILLKYWGFSVIIIMSKAATFMGLVIIFGGNWHIYF